MFDKIKQVTKMLTEVIHDAGPKGISKEDATRQLLSRVIDAVA